MAHSAIDTRNVTLVDLPLVKRLTGHGIILDSKVGFTRNTGGTQSALFSNLLLWRQSGLHTLVARADDQQVLGQFHLKPDADQAQLVYIAPRLEAGVEDTPWLHVLDAMAAQAGKRGAHTLTAEVDERSPLFESMRRAGYAVYARQGIWRRPPGHRDDELAASFEDSALTEAQETDDHEIHLLYCHLTPRLVQQISPPGENRGFVYRVGERLEGYVTLAEGKYGVYLMPYLHPDIYSQASSIIEAVTRRVDRAAKAPVYLRVRRYQDWLDEVLLDLGFELVSQQAVLVKRLTAGVRQPAFAPLHHNLETAPSTATPPPGGVTETYIETNH